MITHILQLMTSIVGVVVEGELFEPHEIESDDIWNNIFNEHLALYIPEDRYNDALTIINKGREYYETNSKQLVHQNITVEDFATLYCMTLSKLIVWDILFVEPVEHGTEFVQIWSNCGRKGGIVEVEPITHTLKTLTEATDGVTNINELSDNLALKINTDLVKRLTGRSVGRECHTILHQHSVSIQHQSNWMIGSKPTLPKNITPIPRSGFNVYNDGESILIKDLTSSHHYTLYGRTAGECNCISPLYYCVYSFLTIDGIGDTLQFRSTFAYAENESFDEMVYQN